MSYPCHIPISIVRNDDCFESLLDLHSVLLDGVPPRHAQLGTLKMEKETCPAVVVRQ